MIAETQSLAEKRMFYGLDAIRGVLAILVMLRHITVFVEPVFFQETYLAVDIFFLLSGIVVCQAYEDKLLSSKITAGRFLLLRLIRIWPLYFLGLVISFIAIVISPTHQSSISHGALYFGLGLVFLPNPMLFNILYPLNPPAWSLFLELVANAVYGFFVRRLRTKVLLWVILTNAIILFFIAFLSDWHHFDIGFTLEYLPISFARVGYSFFLGVAMYRVFASKPREVITGIRANLLAGFILYLISAILLTSEPSGLWRGCFDFVCVTLVFPCLIYISLFCNVTSRFKTVARFLGLTSYAVYVIHVPVSEIFQSINRRFALGLIEASTPWGGLLLCLVVIALAYALDRYFDRPVRRFACKLFGIQQAATVDARDNTCANNSNAA